MELFSLAWSLLTSPLLLLSAVFGSLTLYVGSSLHTTSKPV